MNWVYEWEKQVNGKGAVRYLVYKRHPDDETGEYAIQLGWFGTREMAEDYVKENGWVRHPEQE